MRGRRSSPPLRHSETRDGAREVRDRGAGPSTRRDARASRRSTWRNARRAMGGRPPCRTRAARGSRTRPSARRPARRGDDGARDGRDRSPGAELADHVIATEEQDQSWCHNRGLPLAARGGRRTLGAHHGLAPGRGGDPCPARRRPRSACRPRALPPPSLAATESSWRDRARSRLGSRAGPQARGGARLLQMRTTWRRASRPPRAAATRWTGLS